MSMKMSFIILNANRYNMETSWAISCILDTDAVFSDDTNSYSQEYEGPHWTISQSMSLPIISYHTDTVYISNSSSSTSPIRTFS